MTTATADAGISTAWGFNATANADGSLTVHDVPVFVTCQRSQHDFNESWLSKALVRAQRAADDGYLPPLHVRHHGDKGAATPAGVFRIKRKDTIRFKGELRPALMADLIVTNPAVIADILAKRLPYRSVEIFNVDEPNIDSLALLDHEAPFLELPMLVVKNVTPGQPTAVAGATFSLERSRGAGGVVCSFRRGKHAAILMEATPVTDEPKDDKADKKDAPKGESKGESKGKGEGAETKGLDVAAVVEAIKSGSITIADFDLIKAAMAEKAGSGGSEDEAPEAPPVAEAPPASAPGAVMKRGTVDAVEFAKVAASERAARAELEALKSKQAGEAAVNSAMDRLKNRALGADLRQNLMAFHAAHGDKAFDAYVTGLEASAPAIKPNDARKAADFSGERGTFPAIAMKWERDGIEAVERAAKFAREWELLSQGGFTRVTCERYVEINMAGGPSALVK